MYHNDFINNFNNIILQNALLHETCEEWEQFERKLKDVKSFIEKSQNAIESVVNKKRTLREQHDLREKMLADITIQRKKITLSTEKLQVKHHIIRQITVDILVFIILVIVETNKYLLIVLGMPL